MNTFDRAHIPPGKLSFSVKRTCICTCLVTLLRVTHVMTLALVFLVVNCFHIHFYVVRCFPS